MTKHHICNKHHLIRILSPSNLEIISVLVEKLILAMLHSLHISNKNMMEQYILSLFRHQEKLSNRHRSIKKEEDLPSSLKTKKETKKRMHKLQRLKTAVILCFHPKRQNSVYSVKLQPKELYYS